MKSCDGSSGITITRVVEAAEKNPFSGRSTPYPLADTRTSLIGASRIHFSNALQITGTETTSDSIAASSATPTLSATTSTPVTPPIAESTPNSLTLFVPLGYSPSTSKSPTIEVIGESIHSQ